MSRRRVRKAPVAAEHAVQCLSGAGLREGPPCSSDGWVTPAGSRRFVNPRAAGARIMRTSPPRMPATSPFVGPTGLSRGMPHAQNPSARTSGRPPGRPSLAGVGVHFLHAYQVLCNAGVLLDQAYEARQDADKAKNAAHAVKTNDSLAKAADYLSRYLGFHPDDAGAE